QGEGGALLFAERILEVSLGSLCLRNGVAKKGGLSFGGAPEGVVRFAQSRFRRHHSGMFLFVTKGKGGDVGLDLGNVATRLVYQRGAGNARDRDQQIDVFASLFDLVKLTFQALSVGLGRGQFAAKIL